MNQENEVSNTHRYNDLLWERINKDSNSVWALFSLMINRYFRSSSTILVYIFPLVLFFGSAIVLPAYFSPAMMYSSSLIFSGLIIYGITFFNLKKSTIYSSLQTTRLNRVKIYLSILFLILLTNFLMFLYITVIYYVLFLTNQLNNSFTDPLGDPRFRGQSFLVVSFIFYQARWGMLIYYYFIATITIFGTSLFLQSLSKTLKAYMIMSISFSVFAIVFGGTLFNAFPLIATGTWDTNSDVFTIDPNSVYSIDSANQIIKIYPQRLGSDSSQSGVVIYDPIKAPTGFFGTSFDLLWWITQFLPIYYLNVMIYTVFQHTMINPDASTQVLYNGNSIAGYTLQFKYFSLQSNEWISVIFLPYILTSVYIVGGFLITTKFKN